MAREDHRSRQASRGICNIIQRNGNICTNVKGECSVHAPAELRCKSMLESDVTLQCWGYKEDGSEYCSNHCQFPNLGVNAKVYGDECKRLSEPCSLQSFIERFYPGANKGSYPRHADEFLTYIKCMSGCDDLWEVFGCSPPVLAYVKNIVGMISSSGEDPKERAAHTNNILSPKRSPFRVEVTDAGFTIAAEYQGERHAIARL